MNNIKALKFPKIRQLNDMGVDKFISFFKKEIDSIHRDLIKNGALKFQGVKMETPFEFQKVVDSISSKTLNYIDGNSPRTKLADNIYTSTEYDNTQKITMHNELSYSANWPRKIYLYCLQPSETGGETLIADCREILMKMNPEIVSEVEGKGIMYIRNLHGGDGMGPSWQETFETIEQNVLEKYCRKYGIGFQWRESGGIKLVQQSKGIITHKETNERVWFNQIDQFHPIQLGNDIYNTIKAIYETEEDFPMFVKFGDGTHISEEIVRQIIITINEITLAPIWKKNELLLLDNELVSHGRNPYTGNRELLVAMSD